MNKYICIKCGSMAVWYYEPWSGNKKQNESYFCDSCIQRGCSCNIINYPNGSEEYKDELGRLLPCIEYRYSETGYDKEKS